MNKWVKYAAIGIGFLVLFAIANGVGRFTGKSVLKEYEGGKVEAAQAYAAEEMRKQLPMRIDEVTTLQSVLSMGKSLIYNYRIELIKDDINNNFLQKQTGLLRQNVCGQKAMAKVIKLGRSYRYLYMSKDGLSLGSIEISKKSCGF